jgi:cell surface protein SprA
MLLIRKQNLRLIGCAVLAVTLFVLQTNTTNATPYHYENKINKGDTVVPNYGDSLKYPIRDRRGDFVGGRSNRTLDLKSPSNIKDSVVYDPKTRRYIVYEKIGTKYYRTTTSYSFDEYWQLRNKQAETEYFQKRANLMSVLNRGRVKPKLSLYDNLFNRLFGNGKINITPQGNVDITAGYQGQNIKNPTLPERARKSGGFDFDMNAQVNVNADIGGKLKFPINYNTLANFGQDNQLKLDYTGLDDEIVKRFELGNVAFPSRSTLIPGAQQLFGVKTTLQFGKLFITGVIANQKSQRQSANLAGGSASQLFEIKADEYEENRHFLLAQYFKENYKKVMSKLPAITAPVQILRLEVWVTNKNGTTTDTRDVVGLTNLGETGTSPSPIPSNGSNPLYSSIISDPSNRNASAVFANLTNNYGLKPVQDFEKIFARKLDSSQYIFNRQVGFISLSQPLQTDEVLAVAYQYSYNGKIYQVGEFSQDLPPDSSQATQRIIFLKLLKATSQRPTLPIWDLMMKNVYAIGYGTLTPTDFKLDVLYQEPGLGWKRYVPFGNKNQGTPIISLINLDRLNNQNDPQPDGVFDYVEGFTVYSQYSRVMFPVLEPFGRDLAAGIYTDTTVVPNIKDSLFYALYDSIKAVAQQFPNLNRFVLKGSAKISGSADISIGYNIPKGSVSVSAGGRVLIEGIDYDINYDLGTIKITNTAVINSGIPVQVNYENNASFGLQQKSYMGLRWDYLARNTVKTQLSIGGTIVRLSERPFFSKVSYDNANSGGTNEPIRNAMYGLDVNYRKDVPRLTKILDKLPFYKTTAPSSINVFAEAAYLKPGHAPQIGKGSKGIINIDDFDGTQSGYDLRFPPISWALASVPQGATDLNGNPIITEGNPPNQSNNINAGKNRARIAWYQIEPTLQQYKGPNNPFANDRVELSDPRARQIYQKEIFPQRTTGFGESILTTFDLAYFPTDRGPYNYDDGAASVDANGKLKNPVTRWGGLMRSIDQTDFETANIEFIEFWMQDPFINYSTRYPNASTSKGGNLYFNLGSISEDILKDGKRFYENGLPTPNAPAPVNNSNWGRVPNNPQQVTNAFSNDANDRKYQDVGFDGLDDTAEATKRSAYLAQLAANFGTGSITYKQALLDPSSDDYHYYRGDDLDQQGLGIVGRYKNYNNPEGNSPVASTSSTFSSAATLYPDAEDLNRDNTLDQTEEYFQYIVQIKPPTTVPTMDIGNNFIVDKKPVTVNLVDGSSRTETWYQFRIPIQQYNRKVGNIPDFKSIRFIRMFMTGFEDSVVLRFGELQFTRNVWRKFNYKIDTTGIYTQLPNGSNTVFNQGSVNIEENDKRTPLPYRTPTEIERVQTLSNNGVNLLQNEQSLTLQVCNLLKNDTRGVQQTFANRDLRQFRKMQMYIHAEKNVKASSGSLGDKDLTAVFRMGTDFVNNYYEIRIPLILTDPLAGSTMDPNSKEYNDTLWNPANSLDVDLQTLVKLKQDRNLNSPTDKIYRQLQANGHTYSVMGNPNLAEIRGIFIGVENTKQPAACAEVWVNELRLSSIDEHGGWAALGRIDLNLADLGTISVSANTHTSGFGTLEQRINDRYRDNFYQFDVSANLELGKLLPKKAALSIPVFASYQQSVSTPEYDPYDMDIKLKDKLKGSSGTAKDSIKNAAIEYTSTTSVTFTNVRKNRTSTKKPKIYDISNFDISYSYLKIKNHTPLIENNEITRHKYGLGYNFSPKERYIEPFKKIKFFTKRKTHWFDLVKDFNFNLIPSQLSFRADVNRQFGAIRPRSIGTSKYKIPETFDKYYTFQRNYILRWNITRSLNFDFTAVNNSRIDEPEGRLDTKEKKDSVWRNLLKGGRNTTYNHTANFTYTLPTAKFPLIDWTTINLRYQATYSWVGASRLAVELGNIIENSQQSEATAQFDFNRLYQKSKWLRQLEAPGNKSDQERWRARITKYKDTVVKKNGRKVVKKHRKVDEGAVPYVSNGLKFVGKLATSLKQASFSISENAHTRLPGYTDSTKYVGQNWKSMAPGIDFILGRQPDTAWLNAAGRKGLITKNLEFNTAATQSFDQRITLSAQLEPIRDLNITLNMSKTFNKNYSETFRFVDTSGGTNYKFMHLNPYAGGGFDVTYIAFKTLFGKFDPNRVSETFKKFQDYRLILSKRLGEANPYNATKPVGADGYYYGYGKYAIDVLIPAFLAAYTGDDPNTVSLIRQNNPNIKSNPFRGIKPKLNWKVDYNGLSKIKPLDKLFTNFSVSHGYTGNLSMNGFTSALLYQDVSQYGYPSFYDTISKNYVPYFLLPNISIGEQFSPLLGIDMMFTNQLQAKFEYSKTRQLSLSLVDFQLSEVRSTEFVIGAGYRKRGMKNPLSFINVKWPKFLIPKGGDGKKLENEINFRLDFRIRDNVTANSRLDQDNNFATGGSRDITISPSIDYFLNNRVNVKLYFDQRRVNPYISSSAPIVNTRAGLQVRISLTQ